MNINVINIVRDISLICPKNLDIVEYGISCKGLTSKKICYNCINNWRTLREILRNKPKNWRFSLNATLTTLGYKIKFFSVLFNLFLFNNASINVVASKLMNTILSVNVDPQKVKTINITPISSKTLRNNLIKRKQILFLIPSYDASHKGLEFVLNLTKRIPKEYKVVIAGKKLPKKKLKKYMSKTINLDRTTGKDLDNLFQESEITLIPTFCTEAFGRVIVESILNKTPVISSPNCGANEFFENKDFVKVIPLIQAKWVRAIKALSEKPPFISESDIEQISDQFSVEKSIKDFIALIENL